MKKTYAFFDLDGTLTAKDTLFDFVGQTRGKWRIYVYLLLLMPLLIINKLKKRDHGNAKLLFLNLLFKNNSRQQLAKLGQDYAPRLESLLYPKAREKLAWHIAQNHEVVIVSASCDIWLAPWCQLRNLPYLVTEFEYDKNNIFVGQWRTPNCHGKEKVRRIQQYLLEKNPEINIKKSNIWAYGDTKGDLPMLALASVPNQAFYRPFSET